MGARVSPIPRQLICAPLGYIFLKVSRLFFTLDLTMFHLSFSLRRSMRSEQSVHFPHVYAMFRDCLAIAVKSQRTASLRMLNIPEL